MAGVIKQSASGLASAPRPLAFNFADMGDKAAGYLDQVRAQATEMLTKAQAEADQIKAKAQQEGRNAAIAAAEATLKTRLDDQLQKLMPALDSAAQQIIRSKEQWQQHWEKNLVRFATAIAERVIRREVIAQPEIPLTLVREALELAAGSQTAVVHLHPEDHAALGDRVQQIAARVSKLGAVKFLPDPSISRGGCRVETEYGVIDQQMESQLKRIESELS